MVPPSRFVRHDVRLNWFEAIEDGIGLVLVLRQIEGSRSSEKGETSAAALRLRLPSSEVTGTGNRDAASQASGARAISEP